MRVRGSVYVLTTPVSPDLCRISFSAKSPELRVREMLKKKPGQIFVIEYAVIVESPHKHHRAACRRLIEAGKHEWKEWFRCPPEDAAVAIREAVGKNKIYSETVRGVERVRREGPDAENAAAGGDAATQGAKTWDWEKSQPTNVMLSPLDQEGKEKPQPGEEAVVLTPAEGGEAPTEGTVKGEGEEKAPDAAAAAAQAPEEEKLSPEEYLLREQQEALRREQEAVRRALEEKRRMTHLPTTKKGDGGAAKKGEEEEKGRSAIWEILVILLTDIGCIYLIFAAKGTLITVVALVLSALFSLLLVDIIRSQWGKRAAKKE